jgi:hypothetical protein
MRFLFFLFWCYGNSLCSQPGFNITYKLGEGSASFANILLHKDTLVLHGVNIVKNTPPYEQAAMLVWADTNGNILKSRLYFDSLGRDFLYFSGEPFIRLKDGSGYLVSVNVRKNGALMKVNPAGDFISLTEYVDPTSITDFYRQIIEVEDGFYVAGYKQRTDYLMDGFVMKLDKNGKKRWEKYFDGISRSLRISNMLKTGPNQYIIGAGTTTPSGTPLAQANNSGIIWYTDSLMNIQRKWESPYSLEHGIVNDLRILPDNKLGYLTGRGVVFPVEKYYVQQPKVVVRDANFNLVSERILGTANSPLNRLYNTAPAPDGNYVSSGQLYVEGDRGALADWVYKMTPEGDSIWSVTDTLFYVEGGYAEHYLTGTVVLPGGSVIVCGRVDAYKGNAGKSWAWLLKISKDGCIEASNCVPISTSEEPLSSGGEIKAYPNPAGERAAFEVRLPPGMSAADLHIFDVNGRFIATFALTASGSVVWDTRSVISGVYYYRLTSSGGVSAAGKILVSH